MDSAGRAVTLVAARLVEVRLRRGLIARQRQLQSDHLHERPVGTLSIHARLVHALLNATLLQSPD